MAPIYIIIDGNNLIYPVYDLPTDPEFIYGGEHDKDLIELLVRWGSKIGHKRIHIELCFDKKNEHSSDERILSVFSPKRSFSEDESANDADAKVRERVAYHLFQRLSCIVITNDTDLTSSVSDENVIIIKPDDFVSSKGSKRPQFRMLQRELSSLGTKTNPAATPTAMADAISRAKKITPSHSESETPAQPATPVDKNHNNDIIPSNMSVTSEPKKSLESNGVKTFHSDSSIELSFVSWNIEDAVDVILKSFCDHHLEIFGDICRAVDNSEDLQELSNILLQNCASEKDFLTKGTLYHRAIRYLLINKGGPIPLDTLANSINVPMRALVRKLYKHRGKGINILSELP